MGLCARFCSNLLAYVMCSFPCRNIICIATSVGNAYSNISAKVSSCKAACVSTYEGRSWYSRKTKNLLALCFAILTLERHSIGIDRLYFSRIVTMGGIATASFAVFKIGPAQDVVLTLKKFFALYVRSYIVYGLTRFLVLDCMLGSLQIWFNTWADFLSDLVARTVDSFDSMPEFLVYVALWAYVMPWLIALGASISCGIVIFDSCWVLPTVYKTVKRFLVTYES